MWDLWITVRSKLPAFIFQEVPLNVLGIAGFGLAQWPVVQRDRRLSQEAESFGKLTTL